MKQFIETKATRNYDIIYSEKKGRCDLCERIFIEVYELIPEQRLHNFDNIFLCKSCVNKCGFEVRDGTIERIDAEQRRSTESSKTVVYNQE